MFLIFRIIADVLWEYKVISVLANAIMFLVAAKYIGEIKFTVKSFIISIILLSFILIMTLSFSKLVNAESSLIFFKATLSIFLFIIGMHSKRIASDSAIIAKMGLFLILLHLVFSVLKIGYQMWGGANTFSGLYFFKTDLALSMVISLVYALYFLKIKNIYKILLILICLYIVFLTNARIHLLTSFLVLVLFFFKKQILASPKKIFFIGAPVIAISFILFILFVQLFLPPDLLLIDVANFYSNNNMQGRNVIWDTLISKFSASNISSQVFGLGLTADVKINARYADTEEVFNAHSSYLYILISFGYIGCILFLTFLSMVIKRFFDLAKIYKNDLLKGNLLMVFLSIWIIFFVSSFSSVMLIFQQLMWFFFFWGGVLFNKKYFVNINPKKQLI